MYNSFIGGELSPSLFAHTDLDKFRNGATTCRNCFVDYRGGSLSRPGLAYVLKSLQNPDDVPPRLIPFEFNIAQEYGLEFGEQTITSTVTGAANNGAGLVRLTLASTRGIWSGSTMVVSGVTGTTEANGAWSVTVIDATHVDLVGSGFGNAYVSGGVTSDLSGYMRIVYQGGMITEATQNISAITSNIAPAVLTITSHGYSVGDWIAIENVGGVTSLNGLSWIVASVPSANTLTLTDLFGNVFSTPLTYTSGGTAARIYTIPSPYLAADIYWLKFTQSADTISFGCVNQTTLAEYLSYDLVRNGVTNWVFNEVTFAAGINAPGSLTVTALSSTTSNTFYSYVATAVSSATGEESVASNIGTVENNDISINAGSNSIKWAPVSGASSYNVYGATPIYSATIPIGVPYGYIGTALSTSFVDTNITADFTQVPPTHQDPFARGQITGVTVTAGGSGYVQSTVTYSVSTSTGSGFSGVPVIAGGVFVSFYIENAGEGYAPGDTITISTGGTGATATLTIGAESGTYPAAVAYYQQRRVYAYTINDPNTYFMTKPGAYTNMDSSIPTTDADAIIGAPWAQQINGIQAMQPMLGGLMILTGLGAWFLTGGSATAITPSDQDAQAQAYNGCHNQISPIPINYDLLYVQSKGSIIRDLSYNFFTNVWTGLDKTVLSSHLFNYRQLLSWAYAEEPYKVIWAVRDDGIMLSYTYLKEQNVSAFARHDTNGFFVNVISINELPVDAIYVITKRYIVGEAQWAYYIERMDNRVWTNSENCFCVDAGVALPLTYPAATLMPVSATGTSNISSVEIGYGGVGYTNPTITAFDAAPNNPGNGATFTATLTAGVITAVTVNTQGLNYTPGYTQLTVTDPTGTGAVLNPIITNNVTFNASSGVFNGGMVGNVIRIGNSSAPVSSGAAPTINGYGKAIITSYVSATQVIANIVSPITATIPNDPNNMPVPATVNQWSVGTPATVITGLNHIEGMTVAVVGDGSYFGTMTVMGGTITLPVACSTCTVGLPFLPQLQTMYADMPQPGGGTSQGKRKNIQQCSLRVVNSRGISVGVNRPDQSTTPNNASIPWNEMVEIKEMSGYTTMGQPLPLYTGDFWKINLPQPDADGQVYGQVAFQQSYPFPMSISGFSATYFLGDSDG